MFIIHDATLIYCTVVHVHLNLIISSSSIIISSSSSSRDFSRKKIQGGKSSLSKIEGGRTLISY